MKAMIIHYYSKDTLEAIFNAVDRCVFEAGGDGDGWIVSRDNYLNLANFFATTEVAKRYPHRGDDDGEVSFYKDNESISFVNSRAKLPDYGNVDPSLTGYPAGDIVVEIW